MKKSSKRNSLNSYTGLLGDVASLLETARRQSARHINAVMTATYWLVGMRIVEYEQGGEPHAEYGETVLQRLSTDLSSKFGRGFGVDNLQRFRLFYFAYPPKQIYATLLRKSSSAQGRSKNATSALELWSEKLTLPSVAQCFSLPWSAYVRLLSVKDEDARKFYETEALHGGWSVRQLDRQIATKFYERAALSRNKAAVLQKGAKRRPEEISTVEEEIKNPYVLEFLGLKDEYSEGDLEEALVRSLEQFLLELGSEFAFVGRQKRLRIGNEWYRVDLLFFHRKLRCLVVIELKVGKFTHADAGQMHMYLNYAHEHWTQKDENPPVGLILCAEKDAMVAKYALQGLPNKVLAAEYKLVLPTEKLLAKELNDARTLMERRKMPK